MKNKFKLIALGIILAASTASAQFDMFGTPRTIVVSPGHNFDGTTGLLYTNGPVDIRLMTGVAALNIFSPTNTGATGGTLTATLYGSQDQTNMSAVTYALATYTSVSYTNYWYNTNGLIATDYYQLAGSITTPTASSAGWATPYLVPAPFTNTGAITLSAANPTMVGFVADDAPRYLYIVYTAAGSKTNFTVGATLTSAFRR